MDELGASFAGSNAAGALSIGGSLQSQAITGTHGQGSVTISGAEGSVTTCNPDIEPTVDNPCPGQMTVYDRGTVTVTVNGHSDGTSYGSGSDNYSVASGLASAINGDGAASVTAAASNGVLSLTAKGVGLATNYSWSISSVSTDTTGNFGPDSSFWGSSSSGTLSGGVDGTTVWDSGTVNVTIGSFTASTGYGQSSNSTASQVASALASTGSTGLNRSGSPVTATASGATITFTYNSIGSTGNVAVSASSASNSTSYFPSGSFSGSTTLSGGQDAYSSGLAHPYATTYTYDPLNNLTGVSQAAGNFGGQAVSGQARSYSYDSLSRPLNATTPESGTVTNYYTNSSGGTCAGDPSLVCRMQDARGIVKTFSYDAMNRPTGVSYSDGTAPVTYQYDSGGTAAFALDRLTKITEGTGTTPNSQTFAYDNLGRIKSVSQVIDSTAYLVQYGYNALSQIASITYPTNRVVSQNYDAMGRPSAIADGSKTYMNALSFNPAGETLGFTYGNGVQAAFTYNDHLQISTLRYYKTGSSSDILNLSYDYGSSNNGQIQVIHYYTSPSVEDATKSEYFSYDGWGRLSAAHTGTVSSSTPGTWSLTWDYDRLGNRLHQNLVGGNTSGTGIGQPQFTVDVNTNRITNSGFSYDTAGNLTADGTNTYAYDGAGRMKQLNNTAATYTYFGPLRIKKVAGSTTTVYVYSGAAPIVEYVNGSLSKEYIYSGSKLLATLSSGSTTYHHPDHLSNRAETDSSGGVLRSYGHAPFGESWYETGTADKWKFTTYERDAESGLDYAQFRYYGSGQGRFLSADLMGGNPQVPQSLNRYNYSRNDPVNLIDPSGLMVICSQWQHSDDGGQNWYGTTPWQCEDTEGGGGHGALDDGSASGGGGPGGGGTGDGGRRNPVKIDFKKLMDCIAAMFQVKMTSFTVVSNDGTPGTFAGTTQNGEQVSLATDGTTYTSKDLSEIYKKNGGTNNVNGMTFDGFNWTSCCWGGFFSYQTSYVGSDLGYGQMLDNQVHELGHQLAKQTGKEPDLNSAHSEKLATDLQDCYNKKQ